MAVRALSLSGGGARGSFQLGALAAIYDVYGFRPNVIAGTSVGSVNGIMLALARPPLVNDPPVILNAVASGIPDSGLTALRALEAEWATFITTNDFFAIQPAFKGSIIEGLLKSMNDEPSGEPPMLATLGPEIDKNSVLLSIPIVNFFTGPYAASELQKIRGTVLAVLSENSVFNLDPVSTRLNDPTKLTLAGLAAGTPIYLAAVALESGRLRYVDGRGNFTERDGLTPVMSALMDSDIDAALDENLLQLNTARKDRIKGLVTRYRSAISAITADRAKSNLSSTTAKERLALHRNVARNKERGNYLLDALHAQVRGLRVTTNVDPRRGVLASAAMPVFFDPIVIGAERYIDGGVREIIPLEIAVRSGVTDAVGICCSALELAASDDMSNAGLIEVGLRSLTEIALNEVTYSDIEAARARGITCTLIAPTFNVHGATIVNPSLIEISADYGWMRACDEMQPAVVAERVDFRRLSDLITTLRIRCYALERYINENAWFLMAGDTKQPVVTLRTCRWLIRELLAKRASMGLQTHPQERRWWVGWAREYRPVGPFGTSSVWARLTAFSNNGTENLVALEVPTPDSYALDAGSLVDGGNDRVYWIVRGATFLAATETELTTMRTPLVVPHGTMAWLPRIPRGNHLIAEEDTPSQVWIVRNEKRYRSTPGLVAASGITDQVALVPPDGLDQIPDGGAPYWLGDLYISDNLRTSIDVWAPTPQAEGSSSSTAVGLTNRSLISSVVVTELKIISSQDGAAATAFSLTSVLPLTVPPDTFLWVNALFHPLRPGTITGTVSVTCNDPKVPKFAVPLATSAIPLGPHGLLQISPSALDFGAALVGQLIGQNVTFTNIGARGLDIVNLQMADSSPAGQFAIPFSLPTQLTPGQSKSVYVSCAPTMRGRLVATLSADIRAATDTTQPFHQHIDVPLAVTATMPTVFLASGPIRWLRGIGGGPATAARDFELKVLDFGYAAPNGTSAASFWIRNVGDAPLAVRGCSGGSLGGFGFSLANNTIFPAALAPGAEMEVPCIFSASPLPGMSSSSQLRVESDDPLRVDSGNPLLPGAVLTVKGQSRGPKLTDPTDFDQGVVIVHPPASTTFTFRSDGTDPVTVREVRLTDLNPGTNFSVSSAPKIPAALAAGTELTLTVTLTSSLPGVYEADLHLVHNGNPRLTSQVRLRGNVP